MEQSTSLVMTKEVQMQKRKFNSLQKKKKMLSTVVPIFKCFFFSLYILLTLTYLQGTLGALAAIVHIKGRRKIRKKIGSIFWWFVPLQLIFLRL